MLGGGEISAGLMAKNLARRGMDVSVLTSCFNGSKEFEVVDGVKIYRRLETGKSPESLFSNMRRALMFSDSVKRELVKLDKEQFFDIIHSVNITSLVGVAGAKKKIGKPSIAHINSPTPFCPRGILLRGDRECSRRCNFARFSRCLREFGMVSKMKTPFYLSYNPFFAFLVYRNFEMKRDALKKFDYFIPISTFMKKLLLEEGVPKERMEVIPNIVETEKFLSVKNEEHAVPRILYLGPYAEFKGPQILLSALLLLEAEYECDLYGKGYFEEKLKDIVKEKGLKNVRINPEVPYIEVPRIYQGHDILVFPSLVSEAFGRVAIEAMASGKPVIASRIGGVTDIVEDGKSGLLVAPGDAAGLTEALERLISDAGLRERMGREGRRVAAERYTADAVTHRVIGVYGKLAGAGR